MREDAVADAKKVLILMELEAETESVYRLVLPILWKQFRKSDQIGRLGENQIAVFVDEPPEKEVLQKRMEKICQDIQTLQEIRSCYVGIVLIRSEEFNYERMVRQATEAVDKAKKEKNGIGYYPRQQ